MRLLLGAAAAAAVAVMENAEGALVLALRSRNWRVGAGAVAAAVFLAVRRFAMLEALVPSPACAEVSASALRLPLPALSVGDAA